MNTLKTQQAKEKLQSIGLTEKQIEALSLWWCEGLTQRQVASTMGTTQQAVARLCARAEKKIKKSGNSLGARFALEKRPKMLSLEKDEYFEEGEIIAWF